MTSARATAPHCAPMPARHRFLCSFHCVHLLLRGCPRNPAPEVAFWQLPPEQQAALLVRAVPPLKQAAVLETIKKLRASKRAPAAAGQRVRVRTLCAEALGTLIGGRPVNLVQADAASSLGQEAGGVAHTTTWSLAGDSEMVDRRELVTETCKNPQFQMWFGGMAGEPVLTGKATAVFHWMLSSPGLNSPLESFHAVDIVPATSLLTNEKKPNGCYEESPNQAELVRHFEDDTIGFFLNNPAYPALCAQGRMGAGALASQSARRRIELTRAGPDVYKLFGLKEAQVAFTTSSARTFGLHFLGGGEQLAICVPSLGSALAGPASGGGADCVVCATNAANILRAFCGFPPIDLDKSPLSALTTGKGRNAAFLQRLFATMAARGMDGWRHPSQIGGQIGGL